MISMQDAESIRRVVARLRTLYGRYDEGRDQERVDKLLTNPVVIEQITSCHNYQQVFSCFMELQMRSMDKARWGNNVPKDIFHVEEILSFYPHAKFLVCVRDVRDFLLSYKNKWRNTGKEHVDRVRRLYHPVVTSLLWKASIKQIMRVKERVPRENFMLIQYESLVQNPDRMIRKMCDFIAEDFEEDMLNVDEHNSSFQPGENGIYDSSVGRWRRLLTNEEVYIAQQINKGPLRKFGYETVNLKVSHLKVGCVGATLPYGLWRALHANRATCGPLLPYVIRRVAALLR
jgi:Sulfotransferase family